MYYLLCRRDAIRPNPGCRPCTAAAEAAGEVSGARVGPKSDATGS